MPVSHVLGYVPAQLKKNKSLGEFIEYFVLCQATGKMVRQRMLVNKLKSRFSSRSDFRAHISEVIVTINAKLAGGWTPFNTQQDSREFTPFDKAMEMYVADRKRDLRDASIVSYVSTCKLLTDWLASQGISTMAVNLFNGRMAIRYMDYLLTRPRFNNNTYNTYLKKYRACFNWLKEHAYVQENPFEHIKPRMELEKKRGLIPADAREKVLRYVRASDVPNYEIVLHLVFSSLIRPSEIERLQVEDVDFENRSIHISSEKAKTHIDRHAPLSDDCIVLLRKIGVERAPKRYFLLGKDLVPAREQCWHGKFKKEWMKVRAACGLPDSMQLYSLKDSGITEMLQSGIDPLTVMKAADHHDLSITTRYASHRDDNMIKKVRELAPHL